MDDDMVSLHVNIPDKDMEELKLLCLHKGDLSFHVRKAIKFYLKEKRGFIDRVAKLRDDMYGGENVNPG